MENTMTMTGAVEMTGAFARVWSECPQVQTRRLAVTQAPVPGIALPISGLRFRGRAAQGIAAPAAPATQDHKVGTTASYMDVTPFRFGRPPV